MKSLFVFQNMTAYNFFLPLLSSIIEIGHSITIFVPSFSLMGDIRELITQEIENGKPDIIFLDPNLAWLTGKTTQKEVILSDTLTADNITDMLQEAIN